MKVLFAMSCLIAAAVIVWVGPQYLKYVPDQSLATWIIGGGILTGVLTITGMWIMIADRNRSNDEADHNSDQAK